MKTKKKLLSRPKLAGKVKKALSPQKVKRNGRPTEEELEKIRQEQYLTELNYYK